MYKEYRIWVSSRPEDDARDVKKRLLHIVHTRVALSRTAEEVSNRKRVGGWEVIVGGKKVGLGES